VPSDLLRDVPYLNGAKVKSLLDRASVKDYTDDRRGYFVTASVGSGLGRLRQGV
jgi:hypothetical protein